MPLFIRSNRIKQVNSKSIRDNRLILSRRSYFKNFILLKNLCFFALLAVALGWFCWAVGVLIKEVAFTPMRSKQDKQPLGLEEPKAFIANLLQVKKRPELFLQDQIGQDLIYLGQDDNQRLLFGLVSDHSKRFFSLEEAFFLSFEGGQIVFASQGPIQVRCQHVKKDQVVLEIASSYLSEPFSIELRKNDQLLEDFVGFPEEFSQLAKAKIYPQDLLRQSNLEHFHLMELPEASDAFFIEKGSWLGMRNGRWELRQEPGLIQARVESATDEGLSIQLYDQKQGISKTIQIPFTFEPDLPFSSQELFKDIKLRGDDVVVCKIGKQNCLLKKGDWLIKNQSYWKMIKSSQDLERCIQMKTPGELFIFEGLEKKQNQLFFKGIMFTKMRTKSYLVEIPMDSQISLKEKKYPKKSLRGQDRQTLEKMTDQDELVKHRGK